MKRLHTLGYAQELFRAMGGFSNFAISFTIISILSGCVTLFYLVPITSGYSAASIGWPLVTVFVVIVALGMAELASAYPTAGGLYYWASKLGGPGWGWYTGWFNLIGQFAITAGIDFKVDQNFNATGFPIWYAFLLSLLLAQYTYTGYDASAHMTEETVGAATRAPWGVLMSVVVSAIAGYALLMGLVAASPDLAAAGSFVNPVLYILQSRLSYVLGTALFAVIAVAQFFCGMSSITSNSRMIYAFSRYGAVPFHATWHRLDRGRTPRNAIILSAVCAFILAAPTVVNYTAYLAVTSIATIGLYIAYALPILLRLMSKNFKPGPWHLGAWSKPIGIIAVIWVAFISVLFMLPAAYPITATNFNYTPGVGLVTLLS